MMANAIDTKIIGKLADVLNKNNLSELEYEDETCRIKIKGLVCATTVAPVAVSNAPQVQTPSNVVIPANVSKEDAYVADGYSNNAGTVKSPIVGVVYLSPDPTKPDYVGVGDTVKEGDIVCLIEAMKTFNPVKAHRTGTVTKILVESGDPVEYGESLLVIE
ncbi:MAG: acetyl-CoA carboxylase biotin carboxyl carrier protein [Alphaproteobacteria bacterium]|nr:acetyl-CoA carboxylase biotin carboxyl carrier protein [Alphaproteobacteria bacterium]